MRIVSSVFPLLLLCKAAGSEILLTGTVVDYLTGAPVVDAVVYLPGRGDIEPATTNAEGAFRLPPLATSASVRTGAAPRGGERVEGVRFYDVRGRIVSVLGLLEAGGNSSRSIVSGGCYLAFASAGPIDHLSRIVVADGRGIAGLERAVCGRVSGNGLAKRAAQGDGGGEVRIFKSGYFSSAVYFFRDTENLPPARLLRRDQVPGSCGSITARTAAYSTAGNDTLVVAYAQKTSVITYCSAQNSPASYNDTIPAESARSRYRLVSASVLEADDDASGAISIDEDNNGSPNAVILGRTRWLRSGTGSGRQGTWRFAGRAYGILSGGLSDSAIDALSIEYDRESARGVVRRGCMTISADAIVLSSSAEGEREGAVCDEYLFYDALMRWSLAGSAAQTTDSTIVLAGAKTADSIRITFTLGGDIRYQSIGANPDYPDHTCYKNPFACPNQRSPSWLSDFLSANESAGLSKKSVAVFIAKGRKGRAPGADDADNR